MSTVFVSGANGYIAQHLVLQLLAKNYKVIGSVRSVDKGEKLAKNFNNANFQYEIIPDITKPDAFDQVLEMNPQIEGFFHTASPVFFNSPEFEKDVIIPAIEGTKNVLSSVKRFGTHMKRFIFTSSFAAIGPPNDAKNGVITEDTWCALGRNDATNPQLAYKISKTWAEKEVWQFFESENPKFDFNIINPSYVFGPQAFDSDVKGTLNFSAEIVNEMLKLRPNDPVPTIMGLAIDVRDVARSHILAYETPDFSRQRFIVAEKRFTSQDLLDFVNERYPDLNLAKGEPGSMKDAFKDASKIDDSKSRSLLGPYISFEQSVCDTVDQIMKNKA